MPSDLHIKDIVKAVVKNCHLDELPGNTKIAVAVSGGVDSLCTLLLLAHTGIDIVALHGSFLPENPSPAHGLAKACEKLHVPLNIAHLESEFKKRIIRPFISCRFAGLVPNPCAWCNRDIKFGALLKAGEDIGANMLATGHYARTVANPWGEGRLIASAEVTHKDQSYFLSLLNARQTERAIFPIGFLTKDTCRKIVAQAGLEVPLPQESQDICFITADGGNPNEFIQAYSSNPHNVTCGPVFLKENDFGPMRRIGKHYGLWNYTPGQRKGLGIAFSEPLYVLDKDVAANTLIVGPRKFLGMEKCEAAASNIMVDPRHWPQNLLVKVRYNSPPFPANVKIEGGQMFIHMSGRQFPTAPGQIAAVYDYENRILAGGIIRKIE